MKLRIFCVVILSLCVALPVVAETSSPQLLAGLEIPLTLNDVINLMIDRNLDINSNRLSPISSRLQSLVFYRFLQPSITVSGSVSRDSSASTTQLNGATALSQLRHSFSLGYAQTLPTGTTFSATGTMNRTSSNSVLNTFNPSYSGRVTYSISQHLLRDRPRIVNMRQILQGQNNEKISEAQFELQLINLIVTAQKSYWDLVFSNEDLKVKQRSLGLAEQTLEENKAKVEIGTMAPIDVVQTRADVASRRELVVVSTGSMTQSEDQIKKLISSENDPEMFLVRLRALETPRRPDDVAIPALADAIKVALENRAELRQALLDEQNRDLDVQYTRNQKLPQLDITAAFNQNGTGGTQTRRGAVLGSGDVQEVIPGGLGDALNQLFGYHYTGYSLGFSLVIPLKNKAAEADYSRAINERKLADSRINATSQNIALEVRNAIISTETNRARIDTAQTARELAEEKLEAEKTKFDLGVSTLRFVLEEQRNVAQAQSNELQAVVNFTKSLVDLDKAMGLTLKKNNVEIDRALAAPAAAAK
ncbi:MAG TPA: TolC family protein [Terriglobia bacterium]|nr:TolC family protein [Terriglobia bacterium]